jgi:hypothetical protein
MNQLVQYDASTDGFLSVPQTAGGTIRGSILKFSDGEYTTRNGDCLNNFRLVAVGAWTGWVRWSGGKPAETIETTGPHPLRDELGWFDESQWESGLDGSPADPWRDTRNLYLVNQETGEEFTFSTMSFGGRRAVEDLVRQISNIRTAHPRACPIVELHSEKMKTRFGMKQKPKFSVVGWTGTGDKPVQQKLPPATEIIDDDIPFTWVAALIAPFALMIASYVI